MRFFIPAVIVLFSCCSAPADKPGHDTTTQSVRYPSCDCDTINFTDWKNIKHGRWIEWKDTARHIILKQECLHDGVEDGFYMEYQGDPGNHLKVSGNYKSGKRVGEWKYYADGSDDIIKVETWTNDTLVSTHLSE